jgi:hypothetical protein
MQHSAGRRRLGGEPQAAGTGQSQWDSFTYLTGRTVISLGQTFFRRSPGPRVSLLMGTALLRLLAASPHWKDCAFAQAHSEPRNCFSLIHPTRSSLYVASSFECDTFSPPLRNILQGTIFWPVSTCPRKAKGFGGDVGIGPLAGEKKWESSNIRRRLGRSVVHGQSSGVRW